MVRNQEIYKQVAIFRERGFSYTEIARMCNLPKSTVATWCKDLPVSPSVREENKKRAAKENAKRMRLLNTARHKERTRRYTDIERSARTEFKHYAKDPLFFSGVLLYRALGDINHSMNIRFTCTDPELHKVFIGFLRKFLGIKQDSIGLSISIPQSKKASAVHHMWMRKTKLPKSNIQVYTIPKSSPIALQNPSGRTIICSTAQKRRLLTWIKQAERKV